MYVDCKITLRHFYSAPLLFVLWISSITQVSPTTTITMSIGIYFDKWGGSTLQTHGLSNRSISHCATQISQQGTTGSSMLTESQAQTWSQTQQLTGS